jgi:hypothetical protein
MRNLLFLLALAPALATAQVQVQAGASFTLDLPIVIPQLVVVQPGIQVVPDVEYEVFRANGFYWTRHEGGWYRSSSPRSGWVFMPRGVPPGLSRMPPGKYKRWKPGHGGPAPAFGGGRPAVRGGAIPGPVFRGGDDRHGGRHDDHGRDHDDDRGRGGKHKGKRGKD